jgi:hypothetical protein
VIPTAFSIGRPLVPICWNYFLGKWSRQQAILMIYLLVEVIMPAGALVAYDTGP